MHLSTASTQPSKVNPLNYTLDYNEIPHRAIDPARDSPHRNYSNLFIRGFNFRLNLKLYQTFATCFSTLFLLKKY